MDPILTFFKSDTAGEVVERENLHPPESFRDELNMFSVVKKQWKHHQMCMIVVQKTKLFVCSNAMNQVYFDVFCVRFVGIDQFKWVRTVFTRGPISVENDPPPYFLWIPL